jgi:regulator of protease activity HflC (stomatin/prohibitin superfamily)
VFASVPAQHAYLVERLGRYHRTLSPGFHVLVPLLERVRAKVDLREREFAFRSQPVVTADDQRVEAAVTVWCRVVDPVRAVYEISRYDHALEQLAATMLRAAGGELTREAALASRHDLNRQLLEGLSDLAGRWGLRIDRTELTVS